MTKIRHEERFNEATLAKMFSIVGEDGKLRDIRPPRRKRSNKRVRPVWTDTIKAGVTTERPGKRRVADLVRFYHTEDDNGRTNEENEVSAFEF